MYEEEKYEMARSYVSIKMESNFWVRKHQQLFYNNTERLEVSKLSASKFRAKKTYEFLDDTAIL